MAPASELFESTDVAEVEEYVSRLYSKMRIGAVGEDTRARIHRRHLGADVELHDLDYTFDIGYDAEPPDRLIVCDVVSSTIESGSGDGPDETFGPGDQFLICRPGLPYHGLAHATRLRFMVIDPAVLTTVATNSDDAQGPVRFLHNRPVSRQAQLQLQRCLAYVRSEVVTAADAALSPLLVSAATRYLAASLLNAYPNTAVDDARACDVGAESTSVLGRAVAFVEAHPDQPLTVSDIAHAAYVTPRALQLTFRHHLDTTPMAYLRQIRLDLAHEQLRAADAGSTTVTAIASRWGFTPSRFTEHYRAAYGETPSATLRRD